MGLIDRYTGVTPIQISTIRRQLGRYHDAVAAMANGRIPDGFDQLDRLGWVHELDSNVRNQKIAADYADAVSSGRSALVVSPTHREADQLTLAIRETLRERNRITGPDHEVLTLQPLHLTEGERQDPAFLRDGDVLIFHQNAKSFRKGTRLTVNGDVPQEVTDQAPRWSVYRPSSLQLASGDLIRITAGGRTKDGHHRLNNGSVFEVAAIEDSGDVRLSNGWLLDRNFGHLAYGFVSTSHASQGRTVDHVFIAESSDSFPAASREQMYVSASRGRRSVQIYTDSKADLRDAIEESSAKTTASEMFWPVPQQERHKRQQQAATRRQDLQPQQTRELIHER
jgi:hypothetical protein